MPSAVDLPFPELTPIIDDWWRGTHEPGVPPHITLLYPWVDAVGDAEVEKVRRIAAEAPAFDVSFTAVEAFTAGAVYLRPEPDRPIRDLIARLAAAFPETPLYGGAIADPIPHLTLARTEPGVATESARRRIAEALAPHLPVTVSVTALAVMEPDEGGVWRTLHEIALGG
ncbi:2'-5' RNA ligase family protein [Microbacterium sp. NPDC090218]